tara:strand:+ start:3756 stop:5084 length:1329 start_codon:yes stop_codon:yes gene_type:complete
MKYSKTQKISKKFKKNISRKANKNLRVNKKHIKRSSGGSAIASGGFGCVFKPYLRCKDKDHKSYHKKNTYVSKLLLNKYAYKEMDLIKSVLQHVNKIPNYRDYFLISDIYMCQPKALTKKDLQGFKQKCKNLKSRNITQKNINKQLSLVKTINIPYGGIDIDNYFEKWNKLVPSDKRNASFKATNNSLIKLLTHGIVKMNEQNYYHLDVKGGNILRTNNIKKGILDIDNIKTRLIDWGLAVYHDDVNIIPKTIMMRPYQYNLPFSVILLNNGVQNDIDDFLEIKKQYGQAITKPTIFKELSGHLFGSSTMKLGEGHLEYIIHIIETLHKKQYLGKNLSESFNREIGYETMINYIEKILQKYTDDNYKFNATRYFNDIFLKNVDVWGFLVSYIDLAIENKNSSYLSQGVASILRDFCFSDRYAIKVIPVEQVASRLENLNRII